MVFVVIEVVIVLVLARRRVCNIRKESSFYHHFCARAHHHHHKATREDVVVVVHHAASSSSSSLALGMLLLLFVVVVVVVVVVVLCPDVVHALNTDGGGDASSFTIGFPSISASEHDANARLLRTKLTNPPRGTLNIALITCEFDGPTNNGGIGTQFTALAKLYAKNGHFVTVVFTEGERYEQQQHSGVPHTHVSSIVTSRERRFCKKSPPDPGCARSDRC